MSGSTTEFEQKPMLCRWMDDGMDQSTTANDSTPESEPVYTCTQCDEQTNGNSQLCVYCKNAVVKKTLGNY